MLPANLALPLRRNAAPPLRLSLITLDEDGGEVPLDLAGYALKLDVRMYPGAPGAPEFSVSTTSGEIEIVDAPAGIVQIDWPKVSESIAALPSNAEAGDPLKPRIDTFCYDLLLVASDGTAQAILEGPIPVSFGVTRNG